MGKQSTFSAWYVAGKKEEWDEDDKATARGAAGIGGLFLALLLLL